MKSPHVELVSRIASIGLCFAGLCASTHAADRFVAVSWPGLRFEGEAPKLPLESHAPWNARRSMIAQVRVVLDGPGEVFLHASDTPGSSWRPLEATGISIRCDEGAPLKGRLFVPDEETHTFTVHRFEVATQDSGLDPRVRFYNDMEVHYSMLLADGLPGAAWFRHRADEARRALGEKATPTNVNGRMREPADPLDLFTGARAVAENLDLERVVRIGDPKEATIDVGSIEGVTTRAYDWKKLIEGKKPELDPLAKFIPADQHAVFFPTFDAMVRVFDEADAQGTPLLEFFSERAEDLKTKEKYQNQLLLPMSTMGRLLGPTVISSVAITGSDPCIPSGTDIAVLFDCKEPTVLEGMLAARRTQALKDGAVKTQGDFNALDQPGHVTWIGCQTTDHAVSSYVARFGSVVVVANSRKSLSCIGGALNAPETSLANADEYKWFRDRYKRGEEKESALLVLTDATIRRWAGPRNRIGDARRLQAAAAMDEVLARRLDDFASASIGPGTSAADATIPLSADFVWTNTGLRSPKWGSPDFLTPICELDVDKVSAEEKTAYDQFRARFQSRWNTYFDPIAVRLVIDGARLRADVTVRPLTLDSDYKEIDQVTHGAELPDSAGDPHTGTLFHFAFGFNKTNELASLFSEISGGPKGRFGADPLAWLGSNITVYGEHDPWWKAMREATESGEPEDIDYYKIPMAVQIAVKDPLKLAVFLTALHAFADESAPNLTKWENRTWQELGYVRIAASEALGINENGREAALYYVSLPNALVLTPREDLLKQAIDRYVARKAGQPVPGADVKWLGKSAGLRIDREAIDLLSRFESASGVDPAARAAWSALPILDEWYRRHPNEDPVAFHERIWGVRLVSPAGGTYVWNDAMQAMESTDYGMPGAPRTHDGNSRAFGGIQSAELGLTFEDQGVRAVVEMHKSP